MKVRLIILNLFFIAHWGMSQIVESENKIVLTNPDNDKRKIKDLVIPIEENDAVSENFFLSGKVNYALCSGSNDTLHLTIYPNPTNINAGLIFNFISPIVNDQSVVLDINGSEIYYPVTKKGIDPLDTSDIVIGQSVSVIFDGNNFQVFSQLNRSCPVGFIKAAPEYCIQPVENAAVYFWGAVKVCGKQNARVCNWGEWYYACLNSAVLGITDMADNWEWIDAGGNSLSWTTPPTSYTGMQGGNGGSCINIQASIVDSTHTHPRANPKPFHCCYSLIR